MDVPNIVDPVQPTKSGRHGPKHRPAPTTQGWIVGETHIPPVAEKTFITLREAASKHPEIVFIAVSHSSESHTQKWLSEVGGPGDKNPVQVIANEERDVYAKWGLGTSSFWHVLSPWALSDVFKLSREEGIANRPTESGNRWQTSGAWAVDGKGQVTWGGPATTASEIPDVGKAIETLK
ncbi:hypothetical protein Landi51_05277 [Colletotrichum acutatum]